MKKEIIFVVDPMCSWCWGFAPVIESLREDNTYTYSLILGGLRTKGEMLWDARSRHYLQEHWEEVEKSTGQLFSNVLFEKEYFNYDTYPACKAVVCIRELFGMQKAFDYLHALQKSFYTKGQDITQFAVLVKVLVSIDIEVEKFDIFYHSDSAQLLMEHDFTKARSMGANAFPSVVIIDEEGQTVCEKGYKNREAIKKLLKDNNA